MKLLLDTHVWVWCQEGPDRLGAAARRAVLSAQNEVFVSPVSSLEVARHVALGRIELSIETREWIRRALLVLHAKTIDVSHAIALEAYRLPGAFHKDSADRMLVATCRIEDLTLLTADERILGFPGVRTRDARR